MKHIQPAMPHGYIKMVQNLLDSKRSPTTISRTLKGETNNPEIKDALGWIGMEEVLNRLLTM